MRAVDAKKAAVSPETGSQQQGRPSVRAHGSQTAALASPLPGGGGGLVIHEVLSMIPQSPVYTRAIGIVLESKWLP